MEGFDNFFAQASEEQLAHFLNQSNDYYFNLDFNINPCLLLDMILNDARCESISYDAEIKRLNRNHEKNLLDLNNLAYIYEFEEKQGAYNNSRRQGQTVDL